MQRDMQPLHAALEETIVALKRHSEARSIAGMDKECDHHTTATALIEKSQRTLKVRALLEHLVSSLGKAELREKVVKEVVQLRQVGENGTREKEVCPPAMFAKLTQVIGK